MKSWGWRIPFLLALPLGAIGLYIRTRLEETPIFEHIEQVGTKSRSPLKAVIGNLEGWKMIGRAMLFHLPVQIPGFILLTFMPTYLRTSAGFSPGRSLAMITIASLVLIFLQPVSGLLSDRFGRRPMLFVVALLTIIGTYPAFALIQMGGYFLPALGLIIIAILQALGTGTQLAPVMEMFPSNIRYTGYAISIGIAVALIAGNTAYVAQWLVSKTGNVYAPAWLMIIVVIPSLIGAFFVHESNGVPLPD
jgi:MHS family proline/betaine transporter-like MFS transporter